MKNLKPFIELISPENRLDMIKCGVCYALHTTQKNVDTMIKKGQGGELVSALLGIPKLYLAAAVLSGVPIGYVLHKANLATTPKRLSERELNDKIKFYKSLTSNIETGLADKSKENDTVEG